jgi:hypothetical protein
VPDAPVRRGQQIEITLIWKALGETLLEYSGFVHVLGAGESMVGQHDGVPAGGQRATSGWLPGEYVTDRRLVEVRPDAPAGDYSMAIGLYDPATGKRLPVVSTAGKVDQDRLFLPSALSVGE